MKVTQMLFLYLQVLNPFYVFQAFTLTLWLSQGYIEYSVAIIILSVISIVLSVYDLRQVRAEITVGFYLASGVSTESRVALLICHKGKKQGLIEGSQEECFRTSRWMKMSLQSPNYQLKAQWHTMFRRTLRLL